MVGIGEEDDIGVRLKAVVPVNLPHGRSIQTWLGETENDQDGHEANEFYQQQPADDQPRDSELFSVKNVFIRLFVLLLTSIKQTS